MLYQGPLFSETPKSFLGCANWVRSGSLSTSSVAPRRQGLREKGALIIIIDITLGAPYYTYSIMRSSESFALARLGTLVSN